MSEIGFLAIASTPIAAGVAVMLFSRKKRRKIESVDFEHYKSQEIQRRGHYHKIVK